VAFIFHWPLGDLLAMDLGELIEWRGRAVDRWNTAHRAD